MNLVFFFYFFTQRPIHQFIEALWLENRTSCKDLLGQFVVFSNLIIREHLKISPEQTGQLQEGIFVGLFIRPLQFNNHSKQSDLGKKV